MIDSLNKKISPKKMMMRMKVKKMITSQAKLIRRNMKSLWIILKVKIYWKKRMNKIKRANKIDQGLNKITNKVIMMSKV